MACPARIYPFRKPRNHRLPIPRWKLNFPKDASHVHTTYIGVQQHSNTQATIKAKDQAIEAILEWLKAEDGPSASECFTLIDGSDVESTVVWVCYWIQTVKHNPSREALPLLSIHSGLAYPGRASIGIWQERFRTAISRLETNYSGLDYLPGMARMPGTNTEEHDLSAYWGAARDRIPDSAHDLFPLTTDITRSKPIPNGIGQFLAGTNHENLVHIRSGQFWENCTQGEADSYERNLEPTLRAGLKYLCENSEETGAIGLRYLRNEDLLGPTNGYERKETCGAGFFTSLENMEKWAKTHQSHLKIFRGALAHYQAFGDNRKFRTWHEVSVIREGQARFEYVNCAPETGVIGSIPFEIQHEHVINK
ncbi:heme-containing dehydratase protein [Dendryphion nanum]|uniref:Heme-containing dehydratase protein n=1 Tax=Dendryphion nanum TaxID=256645 RepID=A0A9P9CXA4_9PLEO|nr:heme-containing dehydratase protein [Dendryphion nanum]